MNPDLELQFGDGPAFRHPHKADFRPTPKQAILRQNIVNILAGTPEEAVTLSALAKRLQEPYRAIYRQAKKLCMASLAVREDIQKYRLKKDGTKIENGKSVAVKYIQPFSQKIGAGIHRKALW